LTTSARVSARIFLRPQLPAWFALPAPNPPIYADLTALFLIVVGIGYLLPLNHPVRFRRYLWIFGVLLKGAGAALILFDYRYRGAPPSFLLFAVSERLMASLTLGVLLPPIPVVVYASRRRWSGLRRIATNVAAKLMLPFAVLRVATTSKPPIDGNPCRDHE
jgi:hypothetical protein